MDGGPGLEDPPFGVLVGPPVLRGDAVVRGEPRLELKTLLRAEGAIGEPSKDLLAPGEAGPGGERRGDGPSVAVDSADLGDCGRVRVLGPDGVRGGVGRAGEASFLELPLESIPLIF